MKLMVQFYTTGPNDSTIYNRYIVQIGDWRIGGNWRIGRIA